jgi:CheY-like chemotaxis protein
MGGDSSAATIVLIEDDEDIREIMAEVLRSEGYNVFVAADGGEGIDVVRRLGSAVQLILLDYMMPVLDGSQVLAVLKGDPVLGSIPIVVVSAAARTAIPIGFVGIEAWLSKPVEMQRLLQVVGQVVGQGSRSCTRAKSSLVSIRFLARRLVDVQELELATDRGMFPDMDRVGRNLMAAGAGELAFVGLADLGRALVKASRAADLPAARDVLAEIRTYLAAAAQANRPEVRSGSELPTPATAEVRDGAPLVDSSSCSGDIDARRESPTASPPCPSSPTSCSGPMARRWVSRWRVLENSSSAVTVHGSSSRARRTSARRRRAEPASSFIAPVAWVNRSLPSTKGTSGLVRSVALSFAMRMSGGYFFGFSASISSMASAMSCG